MCVNSWRLAGTADTRRGMMQTGFPGGSNPAGIVLPQRSRDFARLRRVRDRLDREYGQPLDVEELARRSHTSPKGIDLRERGWFALHNGVPDNEGSGGEFYVGGHGLAVEDPDVRFQVADSASYSPADRYVLFELRLREARCNGYGDVALPATHDTIRTRTGRGWEAWFDLLDSWSATELAHREIARKVAAELGIDPLAWNAQAITTGYERARGQREVGQRAEGFRCHRAEWLAVDQLRPRSGTSPKTARYDWNDNGTRVHVSFSPKSEAKSVVSVEHVRLPDADSAEEMKQLWRASLARLRSHLEGV